MAKPPKTEKIAADPKTYHITAVNGQEITVSTVNPGDLTLQIIEFLKTNGLTYPLGIMPGGIQEVSNV